MVKIFLLWVSLLLFLWLPKTALSDELLELKNLVRDAQKTVKVLEDWDWVRLGLLPFTTCPL